MFYVLTAWQSLREAYFILWNSPAVTRGHSHLPSRPLSPPAPQQTCLDTQPSSARLRLLVLLLLNVLSVSRSVASDSLRPLCPWNFPGRNTGAGCHFLLQGIFLTQGLSPRLLCLLCWQVDSLLSEPPGQPIHPYVEAEDVNLPSTQGLAVSLSGVPARGPALRAWPGLASLPRSLLSSDGLGPAAGGGPGSPAAPATGVRAGLEHRTPSWWGELSVVGASLPPEAQRRVLPAWWWPRTPVQPLASGIHGVLPWEPFPPQGCSTSRGTLGLGTYGRDFNVLVNPSQCSGVTVRLGWFCGRSIHPRVARELPGIPACRGRLAPGSLFLLVSLRGLVLPPWGMGSTLDHVGATDFPRSSPTKTDPWGLLL